MNSVYLSKKLLEIAWVEGRVAKLDVSDVKERLRTKIGKFRRCRFHVYGRVLDVGMGSGVDLLAMFSFNPEIEAVGVDFCRGALKFAKAILPKEATNLVLADAAYLPFREGVFDAINVSNMLHHHPYKVLKQIIRELALLLKPNGAIIIEEPSVGSEGEALQEEIDSLKSEFETYLKIRRGTASKRLQAHLYDLIPMFRYGTTYPSLLEMVVEKCGLKIESFHVRKEKTRPGYVKILDDLKERIRNSRIPICEREYLTEKVDAIFEKLKLIKPANHKSVVFKAVKPNLTVGE